MARTLVLIRGQKGSSVPRPYDRELIQNGLYELLELFILLTQHLERLLGAVLVMTGNDADRESTRDKIEGIRGQITQTRQRLDEIHSRIRSVDAAPARPV